MFDLTGSGVGVAGGVMFEVLPVLLLGPVAGHVADRVPRRRLLVVLANQWLGLGAAGYGLLLAAIGLRAASGPLLLRRFIRAGDKRWIFGPYAVRGGVDLALAAFSSPVAAGGALVAYGMSTSTGTVAYQSTLQTAVPAEAGGRALAFYDIFWNSARLVSLAAGGLLSELADVRYVYVLSAMLLFVAAAIGLSFGEQR